MSDLSPVARVHSAGRDDLASYRHQIATSTESVHGPAIEAVVQVAITKYRHLNDAYVKCLAGPDKTGSGSPGRQRRSAGWREAAAAWGSAQECLAAALGVKFPKADRPFPLSEVEALVRHRIGALCSGWTNNDGQLVHHPAEVCELHPESNQGGE